MKTAVRAVKISKLKQIENRPALFYPEQQWEELFPSVPKSVKYTKNRLHILQKKLLFTAQSIGFGLTTVHSLQN